MLLHSTQFEDRELRIAGSRVLISRTVCVVNVVPDVLAFLQVLTEGNVLRFQRG